MYVHPDHSESGYLFDEEEHEDLCSAVPDEYLDTWPELGSKLYCGNRFLIGPDDCYNGLPRTLISIIVPVVTITLYLYSICFAGDRNCWGLAMTWLAAIPCTLITFMIVSVMDPGFIPPQGPQDPDVGNPDVWKIGRLYGKMVLEEKWDKNAKIYRPFRGKFDTMSEFNVERFDHWCNWVSNAIGLRNHRIFILFLISINITLISGALLSFKGILNNDSVESFFLSFSSMSLTRPNGLILSITLFYCCAFMVFTVWLFFKQFKLISNNMTTSEYGKPFHREGKPFNQGCFKNWLDFWFKHECFIPSYIFHPRARAAYNRRNPPDQVDTWIGKEWEGERNMHAGPNKDFHIVGRVYEEEEYGEDRVTRYEQRTFDGYLDYLANMGPKAQACRDCVALSYPGGSSYMQPASGAQRPLNNYGYPAGTEMMHMYR
eukprot:GHVL01014627.1.p1 GENE.GHVL01014627.1~~GHVL01014627.1.p1  ORF type:complete len:431 (+),score=49.84 GHVL01014627.1:276-1568(+)